VKWLLGSSGSGSGSGGCRSGVGPALFFSGAQVHVVHSVGVRGTVEGVGLALVLMYLFT